MCLNRKPWIHEEKAKLRSRWGLPKVHYATERKRAAAVATYTHVPHAIPSVTGTPDRSCQGSENFLSAARVAPAPSAFQLKKNRFSKAFERGDTNTSR